MIKPVLTGLDMLEAEAFKPLQGKRVGLLCNHTAINRKREHLLDLALAAGVQVVALFAPEHGFQGKLDQPVASGVHEPTGLPIHSLYGNDKKPDPEVLAGLDAMVYDIADIGLRFYTYTTTMTHCLAACGEAGVPMWVLDRPNPIRGDVVEGPVLDKPFHALSAWHPIPLRHGLTSAELAAWANVKYDLKATLHTVPCANWKRSMWFQETGLPWINPSPNIRNLRQAVLYPAIGTLEACKLSVGRGTDMPFEVFGAPWADDLRLAEALNEAGVSSMSFVPMQFVPYEREYVGEVCRGVYVVGEDWDSMQPVTAAVQIALVLQRLWPEEFGAERMWHLLGSTAAVESIVALRPAEDIVAAWQDEMQASAAELREYWIYK
ncbi:MAG: DUF1343 domain-containing protein [Armatimonadia bacterium]